jgi:hypothetical protein
MMAQTTEVKCMEAVRSERGGKRKRRESLPALKGSIEV